MPSPDHTLSSLTVSYSTLTVREQCISTREPSHLFKQYPQAAVQLLDCKAL